MNIQNEKMDQWLHFISVEEDDQNDVLLDDDDASDLSNRFVKGATLPSILRRLTSIETTSQSEIWSFLLHMNTFVSPKYVLAFLLGRFLMMDFPDLPIRNENSEDFFMLQPKHIIGKQMYLRNKNAHYCPKFNDIFKQTENLNSPRYTVQAAIMLFLETWVKYYPEDFLTQIHDEKEKKIKGEEEEEHESYPSASSNVSDTGIEQQVSFDKMDHYSLLDGLIRFLQIIIISPNVKTMWGDIKNLQSIETITDIRRHGDDSSIGSFEVEEVVSIGEFSSTAHFKQNFSSLSKLIESVQLRGTSFGSSVTDLYTSEYLDSLFKEQASNSRIVVPEKEETTQTVKLTPMAMTSLEARVNGTRINQYPSHIQQCLSKGNLASASNANARVESIAKSFPNILMNILYEKVNAASPKSVNPLEVHAPFIEILEEEWLNSGVYPVLKQYSHVLAMFTAAELKQAQERAFAANKENQPMRLLTTAIDRMVLSLTREGGKGGGIDGISRLADILNQDDIAQSLRDRQAESVLNQDDMEQSLRDRQGEDINNPSRKKRSSLGGVFGWGSRNKQNDKRLSADTQSIRNELAAHADEVAAINAFASFDPKDIADNLTVRLHYLFCTIPLMEFAIDFAYSAKHRDKTLYIGRLREESVRIQELLICEVLVHSDTLIRADIIMKLIATAERLGKMKSHHAMMLVVFALQSQAIYRLHHSWAIVNARMPGRWNILVDLVGLGGNKLALSFCKRQLREGVSDDAREGMYALNVPPLKPTAYSCGRLNNFWFSSNQDETKLRFNFMKVRKEDPNEMRNIRSSLARMSLSSDSTYYTSANPVTVNSDVLVTHVEYRTSEAEVVADDICLDTAKNLSMRKSRSDSLLEVNTARSSFRDSRLQSEFYTLSVSSTGISPFNESNFYNTTSPTKFEVNQLSNDIDVEALDTTSAGAGAGTVTSHGDEVSPPVYQVNECTEVEQAYLDSTIKNTTTIPTPIILSNEVIIEDTSQGICQSPSPTLIDSNFIEYNAQDSDWKNFAIGVVRFDISSLSAGVPCRSLTGPSMPFLNSLLSKIIRLNELPVYVKDSRASHEAKESHNKGGYMYVQSPGVNEYEDPLMPVINTGRLSSISSALTCIRSSQMTPYDLEASLEVQSWLNRTVTYKGETSQWNRSKELENS